MCCSNVRGLTATLHHMPRFVGLGIVLGASWAVPLAITLDYLLHHALESSEPGRHSLGRLHLFGLGGVDTSICPPFLQTLRASLEGSLGTTTSALTLEHGSPRSHLSFDVRQAAQLRSTRLLFPWAPSCELKLDNSSILTVLRDGTGRYWCPQMQLVIFNL